MGVLTRSVLDDGRGSARAYVFKHQHEKDSGRSSSVTTELMGFAGEKPLPVDLKASRVRHWQHCHAAADKTITFVDLCGHEAYLKTTIFGLTALTPHYGMVVVGANMGISKMTREHVGICVALGLPIFFVITKIDLAPPDIAKGTYDAVCRVLKQARKMPYECRTPAEVHTAATSILAHRVVPIVRVNNITGEGHALLRQLLRELPLPPVPTRGAAAAAVGGVLGPVGGVSGWVGLGFMHVCRAGGWVGGRVGGQAYAALMHTL